MELVLYPDPILRKRAAALQVIDDEVKSRVVEMFETMYEENGVGLAAPQMGWSSRLFVTNPYGVDCRDEEQVFINPRILESSGEDVDEEGCLSIPDVRGQVRRSLRISVEAQDITGKVFRQDLEGLPARVVQHEYDHLDGILFIQLLSETDKLLIKKALKDLEKNYRERPRSGGGSPPRSAKR